MGGSPFGMEKPTAGVEKGGGRWNIQVPKPPIASRKKVPEKKEDNYLFAKRRERFEGAKH